MRDNIDIPIAIRRHTKVRVKIPFTNPVVAGKFPFHCHILEHEDGGMTLNLRLPAP